MKVTVCIGSSCHIKGSRPVVERLQERIATQIHVANSNGMGRLEGAGVGSLRDAHQWSKDHPVVKAPK